MDESVTLCGYFWSVVGAMCIATFLIGIAGLIVTIVSCIICPLFGFYPKKFTFPIIPEVSYTGNKGLAPRQSLFRLKGKSFYGYQLLIVIGLLAVMFSVRHWWLWIGIWASVFIAIVFLCWFVYIVFSRVRRLEAYGLVKGYAQALKDRLCPLVEYVD